MKKTFKPGQPIEVEVYNFIERKSEWVPGVFIEKVQASDIPFRYAVEVKWVRLEGFQAAHPDYADSDYPCTLQRTGDGMQVCRSGIGAKTAIMEHVHQLQNLYFSLVGRELVFTPTEPVL